VNRFDGCEPTLTTTTDDGATLELFDLVENAHAHLVEAMRSLHLAAFPEHTFVDALIVRDARLPARRQGIVVHQWLIALNGKPAGYMLSDSNLVRDVAPIHFLSIANEYSRHNVGGLRLAVWLQRQALPQYLRDAGRPGLGAVAETPRFKLRVFRPIGWRELPVTYLEPIHGDTWREHGLDTREVALIWLPTDGLDAATIERLEPEVIGPAAAAFLLDMYHLDPAIPWVADLCREETHRPGPVRG